MGKGSVFLVGATMRESSYRMKIIGVKELKNNLSKYLREKEFLVSNKGHIIGTFKGTTDTTDVLKYMKDVATKERNGIPVHRRQGSEKRAGK